MVHICTEIIWLDKKRSGPHSSNRLRGVIGTFYQYTADHCRSLLQLEVPPLVWPTFIPPLYFTSRSISYMEPIARCATPDLSVPTRDISSATAATVATVATIAHDAAAPTITDKPVSKTPNTRLPVPIAPAVVEPTAPTLGDLVVSSAASPADATAAATLTATDVRNAQRAPNAPSATAVQTANVAGVMGSTDAPSALVVEDPALLTPDMPERARAVQYVTTLAQRRDLAQWMVAEVDRAGTERHIASKAVRNYPKLFPGNAKANLMRASRIWRQRAQLLPGGMPGRVDRMPGVATRVEKQALPGRGRKRAGWSEALQNDLLTRYLRLRSAGFVFTPKTLRTVAEELVKEGGSKEYGVGTVDPRSKKQVLECLNSRWIRAFADRYHILLDVRGGGNVPASRELQFDIGDRVIAYHIGLLARAFQTGDLLEENVETLGVFHFIVNAENGYTLGFSGEQDANYSETMNGSRGMTMLLRVSGGKDAKIETPFMILEDAERSYPLVGIPDDVDNCAYRTAPQGWIDETVAIQYFLEKRAVSCLPCGRQRTLFIEPAVWFKYAGVLAEPLRQSNTELKFFPPNAVDIMQPVETILGPLIKEAWTRCWREMKVRMIDLGVWSGDGRDASGKMFNAGPRYFLKSAATTVNDVNGMVTESGMSYVRQAMIACGLALSENGKWEIGQLHPRLQAITTKHKEHFEGKFVTAEPRPLEQSPPKEEEPK